MKDKKNLNEKLNIEIKMKKIQSIDKAKVVFLIVGELLTIVCRELKKKKKNVLFFHKTMHRKLSEKNIRINREKKKQKIIKQENPWKI